MKLKTIIRAGAGVLLGRITGRPRPMFLILGITNRCDSRCTYCNIPNRKQREMTTDEIFSLLDQAAKMGVLRLGIWGGEPLVRADISQVIKKAKELGFYITLDTNGFLLPKKLPELTGLDHIIISLDGDEGPHDANREAGSHKKVMEALRAATPNVKTWTITVLTKNNLDQVDWIIGQAKKLGFVATFQVLHHNPAMGDNTSLLPEPEEYRKTIDYIIRRKSEGEPIGTSFACLNHLRNWPDYKEIYRQEPGPICWAGKFFFNVDTDGSVYPCSLLIGQKEAPNFLEVGLKKALDSLSPPPCNSCLATCYTDYKLLFNLHFPTIMEWIHAIRRWGKK
ncbi:MAG: radical SAM protein [Candidatus Eremiobacteraeota bacterium]|nr:radical SAM protein [Candidatus Eremiobacteraeota bacterium]